MARFLSPAAASEPFAPIMARPHGSTARQVEALPSKPRMIWPVYGFAADMAFKREPIASFFDYGAAVDLVNHPDRDGFERRELYIGVPQYDRRSVPPIPARHLRHLLDGEALS